MEHLIELIPKLLEITMVKQIAITNDFMTNESIPT